MGTTTGATTGVTDSDDVLRVRADSDPTKLASAIAHSIYENQVALLRMIGAGAVNQGVKAVAIAASFTAPRGYVLACRVGFTTLLMADGAKVSAIIMKVFALPD